MWRPIYAQNAIERLGIVVQFQEAVPSKLMLRIADEFDNLRANLGFEPRVSQQHVSVEVGPGAAVAQPVTTSGWAFNRLGADQSVVESWSTTGSAVLYAAGTYSRWAQALPRFLDVCHAALTKIDEVTTVAGIHLEYHDRFYYQGDASRASVQSLISQDILPMLTPEARTGADLWHVYRGWFEGAAPLRLLMNQNLAVQDGVGEGGVLVRSLATLTKAELRASDGNAIEMDRLREMLDHMHARCNHWFTWSLNQTTRRQIAGLK